MTMPLSLRITLYLLVADGVLALYLAELLGVRGAALVAGLLVASWLVQPQTPGLPGRLPGTRLLVPLAAFASVVDVLYLAENVIDGLVRLLLFLILYKLATLRHASETRTIAFLAFFMLVASSGSAFGVGFLFAFVAFVALLCWIALLQHVTSEGGPGGVAETFPTRSLIGLASVTAVSVFLVAGGLFFLLPRVGLATLPLRARLGPMMTGFSDRVELGSYGSILSDSSVVMRVHLPDEVDPDRLPNLRWRGVVLDTFDGTAWSVRHPRQTRLVRPNAGGFDVGLLRGSGQYLRQEVFLEAIGSEAVFAAARVLRLTMPASVVAVDDMGAVSVSSLGASLRYTVESELDGPIVQGSAITRPAPPLDLPQRERYLQLPTLAPSVPALARQVAAGSLDPAEVAGRLEAFLLRQFRYTLDIQRVSRLDPLEEFLFVRRAGNCEYFAASMAVMLRSLGVPSRVVNGFRRGEWNPFGQYFIVRYSDAHSWVEAYLPGAGWVSYDPTPRAMADALAGRTPMLLYLDSLRLQWHRYVVNWSLRDQIRAVTSVQLGLASLRGFTARLDAETRASLTRAGALTLVAAVGALGAWTACRYRRAGRRPGGSHAPAFYRRALRAAARRGLRPAPGETAREFSGRVAGLSPAAGPTFTRVTALYGRARFGGSPPTRAEIAEAEACVAALGHRRR